MQILLIFSLVIAILGVLFALQNNDPVTVRFLFWQYQSSSALIIMLSILAGVLISLFASLPTMGKDKWAQRGLRKKGSELEKQLAQANERLSQSEAREKELEIALEQARQGPVPPEAVEEPEEPPAANL